MLGIFVRAWHWQALIHRPFKGFQKILPQFMNYLGVLLVKILFKSSLLLVCLENMCPSTCQTATSLHAEKKHWEQLRSHSPQMLTPMDFWWKPQAWGYFTVRRTSCIIMKEFSKTMTKITGKHYYSLLSELNIIIGQIHTHQTHHVLHRRHHWGSGVLCIAST